MNNAILIRDYKRLHNRYLTVRSQIHHTPKKSKELGILKDEKAKLKAALKQSAINLLKLNKIEERVSVSPFKFIKYLDNLQ